MLLGLVDLRAALDFTLVFHVVDILGKLVKALAELTLFNRMHGIVSNHHSFVSKVGKVGLRRHEEILELTPVLAVVGFLWTHNLCGSQTLKLQSILVK